MMKDLFIGQLKDVHALNNDKTVSNGQIIAYRNGKGLEIQNLNMPKGVSVDYDQMTHTMVITIPMNDGDFVVLQDRTGIAEKRHIP